MDLCKLCVKMGYNGPAVRPDQVPEVELDRDFMRLAEWLLLMVPEEEARFLVANWEAIRSDRKT